MGQGFRFDLELPPWCWRLHLRRRNGAVRVRSRAIAASRATSRRFPSRTGCSASRRSSTTSRPWSTSSPSCSTAVRAFARLGPRARPDRSCSVSPVRVERGRVSTKSNSAPRCATSSTSPAECRATGRSGPILLGGAAGVFVSRRLDTPLTFEATRAAGATLGSGVIMVFDETADLVDTLRPIAQFFRDESCGQCVPCRVGSVRQEELLARLAAGSRVRPREDADAAARDRPGDARRLDLRARPDRVVGHRIRVPTAGYGGPVTESFATGPTTTPPATAEILADIIVTPPARASRPPASPPVEAPDRFPSPSTARRSPSRPAPRSWAPAASRASTRRRCATPKT